MPIVRCRVELQCERGVTLDWSDTIEFDVDCHLCRRVRILVGLRPSAEHCDNCNALLYRDVAPPTISVIDPRTGASGSEVSSEPVKEAAETQTPALEVPPNGTWSRRTKPQLISADTSPTDEGVQS